MGAGNRAVTITHGTHTLEGGGKKRKKIQLQMVLRAYAGKTLNVVSE